MGSLKEKEKQNALNEVRLLASINADYIVKYKEAFFDPKANALCIVIEFADGGDLEVTTLPPRNSSRRRSAPSLGWRRRRSGP